MKEFMVFVPRSVDEALEFLDTEKGSVILAGGSDLVVKLKERKLTPKYVVDISHIDELRFIKEDGDYIVLGPLMTHEELRLSPFIMEFAPILHEALSQLGSPQIRNIGTIGGNIVTASPVADSVPPLFVLDATLKLQKKSGKRVVHISEFGIGPQKTIIERNELLTEIKFKKMGAHEVGFFRKLGQRKALSIAKVSVAMWAMVKNDTIEDISIALGAVAPKVVYAKNGMSTLKGKPITPENIKEAANVIAERDCSPITDIRSTVDYRRAMTSSLFIDGCERVFGVSVEV
ncbi:MAG: FAD binding domain-containing protein [bacterium]